MKNPIICALDTNDIIKARDLAVEIKDDVAAVKLGLEFFCKNGARGVEVISEVGAKIFLDLKFYDIPNTVAGAIKSILPLNLFMTTMHAGGGLEMMQRARSAADENAKFIPPILLGVTVLTSFDDISEIGVTKPITQQVLDLAGLAVNAKLDGVVCSPHEIKILKEKFGNKLQLIVPGIRPVESDRNDQKRTMTPKEAIANGADYLVIGRPITESGNPKQAIQNILQSLKNAS
jgi:orotidine-5'-phosphate decarboxylase